MTTKGKPQSSKSYGVSLLTDDQKAMWKRVSARDTVPSRYPHEDFWALCNAREGNGLSFMFQGRWQSYRRLTLEFLSTLTVHKNHRSRILERIDFRLGNRNHTFSMEDLCEVFHCIDLDTGRPSARLKEITLQQEGELNADASMAEEQQSPVVPTRRARSERRQVKPPDRYGEFVPR